jgi:hypothetical protein
MFDIPGFDIIQSTPFDFMHLLFENIVPNLQRMWKGDFKDTTEGKGNYLVPDHI